MTHRTALRRLERFLLISCPAATTYTVDTVLNNQVVLTSSAGTADRWEGGVLSVVSGDALNERIPIASNAGNTIYLATGFDNVLTPHAGDQVTLSGGPLQDAVIELFTQDTVTPEEEAGQQIRVTLNCPGMRLTRPVQGVDTKTRGMMHMRRVFEFNLMLEVPDKTARSPEDIFEVRMALPVLIEQVLARVHWFRSQASHGYSGSGDIEVADGLYEPEGGPVVRFAALNFVVQYGK